MTKNLSSQRAHSEVADKLGRRSPDDAHDDLGGREDRGDGEEFDIGEDGEKKDERQYACPLLVTGGAEQS